MSRIRSIGRARKARVASRREPGDDWGGAGTFETRSEGAGTFDRGADVAAAARSNRQPDQDRVLPSRVVTSRQAFEPRSTLLPEPQQRVLRELAAVPRRFVLYGGTAITLRLGHRRSLDFDLFSNDHFQPDGLEREIPLLRGAVRSRSEPDTLVSVVDRGGLVTVSFFGGLSLQRVADPELAGGDGPLVASLLDLAATKVKVVQDRAEAKDYVDVARLLAEGISLREALAAALAVYGPTFNPLLSLKALAYFGDGDLPSVPRQTRTELERAVLETRVEAVQPLPPLPGGIAGSAPR